MQDSPKLRHFSTGLTRTMKMTNSELILLFVHNKKNKSFIKVFYVPLVPEFAHVNISGRFQALLLIMFDQPSQLLYFQLVEFELFLFFLQDHQLFLLLKFFLL